jgi:hypothetical protein
MPFGVDAAGSGAGPGGDAPNLPIDLVDNPVQGVFAVSTEASWEVDGVMVPSIEIKTPTAKYMVIKSFGTIVSIFDVDETDSRQWIGYHRDRPLRGLPSLETFGSVEAMTTTLDAESQTPTHLRLNAATDSGSWRLVYDFYPTHVTITVNQAPVPYGFAYRGVVAETLETADRFSVSSGTSQGAMTSSVVDWPGGAEWVYLSDPALARSLFMIQHSGDTLVDRYQVKDNDSAMISFGDGALSQLPLRFSLGLLASAQAQAVAARAEFVIGAID